MKPMILPLVIALAANSAFADPSSKSYGYIPGASIVLGQSFSIENPLSSPAPCFRNVSAFPNPNRKISQNANINTYLVTSNSALKVVLGIDEQMDASVLIYSGSGSFDFNSEVDISSSDATVVIQGDAEYGSDIIDMSKASLTAQAQGLLSSGDLDGFRRLCQSEFISSVNYGTRISAVISIKGMSEQEKVSINSSLSGSGGFGPLSASAQSHINSLLTHQSSSTEVKLQVFVRGGEGLPDLEDIVTSALEPGLTIDQLRAGISRIFKSLTWDMAAATGFTTQPYPGVSDDHANLMTIVKEQDLSLLTENFRMQLARYQRLAGDFNEETQSSTLPPDFEHVAPALLSAASEELPALRQYYQALAGAHDTCLEDTSPGLDSCAVPPKPAMPNIDLLYAILTEGSS